MDFMKKLWGNVPGNTAVPSFLLPTLDLDELDKRISDLKAAQAWLEVNLNLLRATIQGLEVQRHTIAAIRSLGVTAPPPQTGSAAPLAPSGLPPGWPTANQSEGATRAGTRPPETDDQAASAAPAQAPSSESASEKSRSHAEPDRPGAPHTSATKKAARKSSGSSSSSAEKPDVSPAATLAGLTANNWLGYMQDQFAKVAQAALASSGAAPSHDSRESAAVPARKAGSKNGLKAGSKPPSKATAKSRPSAKKRASR